MKRVCGEQQPLVALRRRQQHGGFTLFEFVVLILVVAIIFSMAFTRFQDYPEAAERASFLAVMAQLKSGLNLRMMQGIATGDWSELKGLENSNPMDLMLETPANYTGEFEVVDQSNMPRRSWYFDRSAGELVYLANNATTLYALRNGNRVATDEIRIRIHMVYENDGSDSRRGRVYQSSVTNLMNEGSRAENGVEGDEPEERGDWQGLQLRAARIYLWEGVRVGVAGAARGESG